ncbi:hypothetical protein C8R47DRAFT_1205026 [Mycena vitilis]|nr:hypothetical protein C8R47DRAFT_1205026 [Mycena vitilis]
MPPKKIRLFSRGKLKHPAAQPFRLAYARPTEPVPYPPKRKICAFNRDGSIPFLATSLFRGYASEIIQDSPFTTTRAEYVARARVLRRLRDGMRREAGYGRMMSHLTMCEEVTGYGAFLAAKALAAEGERARLATRLSAEAAVVEKARARRERVEARNQDLNRRDQEAHRRAHPPSTVRRGLRIINNLGSRVAREEPLKEDDLYLTDARPPDIQYARLAHICALCHGVKSHPISLQS